MSLRAEIANQKKYLYKILGKDAESGLNAWWILRVRPEKLVIFSAIIDKGNLDIADYGEVLTSGFGTEIPASVLTEYGFES